MDVENNDGNQKYNRQSLGIRHVQVLMLFWASSLGLSLRVNMSLAIVDMTDNSNDEYFDWSIQTQSVILSSFFWGYIVLQIPAGELAARYGGKVLLLVTTAGNSVIVLLIPYAAYYGDWKAVCACRILQGLLQGFLVPTLHALLAKWVPLSEKSRLSMFVYSGCPFGIAFQLLISGFIAHAWGWPAVFYVGGVMGFTWSLAYLIFGADCPATSKFIKHDEKMYILQSLGQHKQKQVKKLSTPWKSILTSPAFLSLIAAHIGYSWGMWTLMTKIPSFIANVLDVNIRDNGILSALPYITMTLMGIPFAYLSEFLMKHNVMSLTNSRRLSNTIAYFGAAIALVALGYTPANITIAIILLSLAVGVSGGYVTGFFLVHIDMAPNFAGTMMGITNGSSNVIAIMGPLLAGFIVRDETDQSEWRKLFYLTAGIYVVTNLGFIIFGTSKRQPWNEPNYESNDKSTEKKPNISVVCDNVL